MLVQASVSGSATNTTTIDDSNTSAITYTGGWIDKSEAKAINNTLSYSQDASGDAAQLSFSGTGIQVIAKTWNNKGMVNVYIDGVLKATVDEYSPTVAYQHVVYSDHSLSAGNHIIKIVATGTKNSSSSGTGIDLDAFIVNK